MKRALIVLLLLAVAGGLFAQVNFGGSVSAGLAYTIPSEGDALFHSWNRGIGSNYEFYLSTSYNHDSGKSGAWLGLGANAGGIWADGANLWLKPIDILRLQLGSGTQGGFGTPGSLGVSNDAAGGGTGISAVLTPALDGMTFSIGTALNPTLAGVKFEDLRYKLGVSFGLPNTLTAVANLANYKRGGTADNKDDRLTNVAFGVGVPALYAASGATGLTNLGVDVVANNVTDLSELRIGPIVGFRVANLTSAGSLSATLRSNIYLPMKEEAGDLAFAVGLSLGLPVVTGVTVNLSVGYENKTYLPDASSGRWDYRAWDAIPKGINAADVAPGVFVMPSVSFSVGNCSLVTEWGLQALLDEEVKIQNVVALRFSVGF